MYWYVVERPKQPSISLCMLYIYIPLQESYEIWPLKQPRFIMGFSAICCVNMVPLWNKVRDSFILHLSLQLCQTSYLFTGTLVTFGVLFGIVINIWSNLVFIVFLHQPKFTRKNQGLESLSMSIFLNPLLVKFCFPGIYYLKANYLYSVAVATS